LTRFIETFCPLSPRISIRVMQAAAPELMPAWRMSGFVFQEGRKPRSGHPTLSARKKKGPM
jgi:hypothetical protein